VTRSSPTALAERPGPVSDQPSDQPKGCYLVLPPLATLIATAL
jgi:hypothetical protein